MKSKIHVGNSIVIGSADSTTVYMKELKKTKSLDRNAELELIKSADTASRNRIIESNLRFVVQVALKYRGMGLELEDLIAFGNIGLFEAIDKFDPKKGVKFITFAVWYIRAEIQKALNDLGRTVRIPSHLTSTEEYSTKSIHDPVGEDSDSETYADRYLESKPGKSAQETEDFKFDLHRALSQLNDKQREAVTRFYGIGFEYAQCMDQIAEELNVTGERARQLVRQAEIALSKMPGIKLLEQYR